MPGWMTELKFVPLAPEWLDACAEIAAQAPDVWSRENLAAAMEDLNRWSFVALYKGEPVGFACFLAIASSADLEMLVVKREYRRRGVAVHLLHHSLAALRAQGVWRCLLEVRESNIAAIGLYKRYGFNVLARRPGMYANPYEDGFLMGLPLVAAGEQDDAAPKDETNQAEDGTQGE